VLSPSTRSYDRVRKLRFYAREGIEHVWLIDPEARSLEVFRLTGEHWTLVAAFSENEAAKSEPFDAVTFDLSLWWPDSDGE
jgi:Uma2 family endonuclease